MYQAQMQGMKIAMNPNQRRSSKMPEGGLPEIERLPSNASLGNNRVDIEVRVSSTKILDWIVLLTPIVYLLCVLTLAILIYLQTPELPYPHTAHNILMNTHQLQNMFPIVDLKNEQQIHINGCPADYERAILGVWDGIHKGVVCNAQNQSCLAVEPLKPEPFQMWKQQFYCIKYDKTAQWITGQPCLKQYKQCSPFLCVRQQLECPITDLLPTNQQGNVRFGNNQFQIIRNSSQSPLLYFNISSQSPCLNNNLQSKFQSGSYYPLSNSPALGCDNYGDYSNISLLIDKFGVSELLKENGDSSSSLPYFNDYVQNTDEYELRIQRRFQFNQKQECRSLNSEIFSNSGIKSLRIMKMIKRNNLPLLIFCAIFVVFSVVSIRYHNHVTFDNLYKKYYKLIKTKITLLVNLGGIVVLTIALIYTSIFLYDVQASNGLMSIDANLNNFIANECIEINGIMVALSEIHNYSQTIYSSNLSYIYATFVGSVIYLITQSFLFLIQYISSNNQEICHNPWSGRINYEISY